MDNLTLLQSLSEAIKLITQSRVEVATGSKEVWLKLNNAGEHLDREVKALLAE